MHSTKIKGMVNTMNNLQRCDGEIVNYGKLNDPMHGEFWIRVVQTHHGEEIHVVLGA